jgi:ferric-dicitrate binding protein FerR (iron transport regulator)
MPKREVTLDWEKAATTLEGLRSASQQLFDELDQPAVLGYLAGTCSPEEREQVEALMRAKPEVERAISLAQKALQPQEEPAIPPRQSAIGPLPRHSTLSTMAIVLAALLVLGVLAAVFLLPLLLPW